MTASDTRRAAETAARVSYGRLVSILALRSRDIAASEDALADAFVAALSTWPTDGVPDNPDAWLLTAARNRLMNQARHQSVVAAADVELALRQAQQEIEDTATPDRRLNLLFVCAHPAIDETIRTPLMLQTVLGLDAAQIGAAFLLPPTTMGQRLVRAKAKIKTAGLRFELPTPEDFADRVDDVLSAIYAAYGANWDAVPGASAGAVDLADEAMYLSRLMVELLPQQPEARGLLALILYCEARRAARRGADGRFIPLKEQDAKRWSRNLIVEAESQLTAASRFGVFGRFQCEAAIQSVHIQRPITGTTNHSALKTLYGLMAMRCPTVGILVGQAAAMVEAGDFADALTVLAQLDDSTISAYQPYWVVRAAALTGTGDQAAADAALLTAIQQTADPAVRTYLGAKLGSR